MKKLFLFLLISSLIISCNKLKPKIDYSEQIENKELNSNNDKKILIAELPVKFEKTDILIFPIRIADLVGNKLNKLSSVSYSDYGNQNSYFIKDSLTGNFVNLTFQDKKDKQLKLTDKEINITAVSFLRDIFNKTGKKYLLYSVNDKDTNNDKEINYKDIKSMYISKYDGTEFKKITKAYNEFYDYKILENENKVFFRTLEDSNKDGQFNNQDKFIYYYLDFNGKDYKVENHNPLKLY